MATAMGLAHLGEHAAVPSIVWRLLEARRGDAGVAEQLV